MLKQALPLKKLMSFQVIAGGCANLNIKILCEADPQPLILRVYLRDQTAAYREQKLGFLLKAIIPLPEVYFIGDYEGYRFAIVDYLPGIPLRDLLLGPPPHDVGQIMEEAGELLSQIQTHRFIASGFFDQNLEIIKSEVPGNYLTFAQKCLNHPTVVETLGSLGAKTHCYLKKNQLFFPCDRENHLVHGDFDPSNILVNQQAGQWKISGILDWEFAFSGSALWDIANMLRDAPQMPPVFEASFITGLEKNNVRLPENWRIRVHLLNILSLLDCLTRSQPRQHPHRCADIYRLIDHIVNEAF